MQQTNLRIDLGSSFNASVQEHQGYGTEIPEEKVRRVKASQQAAPREVIERGAQQLGWELEKLLTMTLQAMAASEDMINAELFI